MLWGSTLVESTRPALFRWKQPDSNLPIPIEIDDLLKTKPAVLDAVLLRGLGIIEACQSSHFDADWCRRFCYHQQAQQIESPGSFFSCAPAGKRFWRWEVVNMDGGQCGAL